MKNVLYIIAILVIPITGYCQEFEFLKKTDTIYLEFKGKEKEKKYNIQTSLIPNNFNEKAFVLSLKNKKLILNFEHVKYKNWEKKEAKITSEVRKVNKLFLKKNKSRIISTNLLDRYDHEQIVCEILRSTKVFYIIDYTEKREKGITLYEVISLNMCKIIE
jgi:hypothetical protein